MNVQIFAGQLTYVLLSEKSTVSSGPRRVRLVKVLRALVLNEGSRVELTKVLFKLTLMLDLLMIVPAGNEICGLN